jgi:hypothetical protein
MPPIITPPIVVTPSAIPKMAVGITLLTDISLSRYG